MNQLSYYVTKRLIVGSKDSSGTIIQKEKKLKIEWDGKFIQLKLIWRQAIKLADFSFQVRR